MENNTKTASDFIETLDELKGQGWSEDTTALAEAFVAYAHAINKGDKNGKS